MPKESEAVAMWRLLDHLAEQGRGKDLPHGTGSIVCDARLALHVSHQTGIGRELLYALFVASPARPVRELHGLVRWACEKGETIDEREGALLRWGRKRGRIPAGAGVVAEASPRKDWTEEDESTRAGIARRMGAA